MAVGWSAADIKFTGLTATGTEVAKGVLHGVFHPDTNLMFGTTNTDVPYLLLQTMAIAVLGTLFGAILAIPFELRDNAVAYLLEGGAAHCIQALQYVGIQILYGRDIHLGYHAYGAN